MIGRRVTGSLALHAHDDLDAFDAIAPAFLRRREAEHNLILGLLSQIRSGLYEDPYLATVARGETVVGVALRTPPHGLVLSHLDDPGGIDVIVEDVRARVGSLPGVLGARDDAARFARGWSASTGAEATISMHQRIYAADPVVAPGAVAGATRDATTADRDLLVAWVRAFKEEAGDPGGARAEAFVDRRLGSSGDERLAIWIDGGAPVSMAATGGPTPNGIRVSAVYTPPERRNRGYASACVAALTQRMLDAGRRFCFLYTDLSNPTSNSIYQRVGYRPVVDVDQYRFNAADPG